MPRADDRASMEPGLRPGQRFGRYEIVRLLGRGGMGAVYEARNVALGKRVAIKTLLGAAGDDPMISQRFVREGQVASRVRHPHIVEVFDADVCDGVPFLVMEFLEGESLADLFTRERGVPLERLVRLALPVVAAMAAAHDAGVVHRDIKPDNVFLAREGRGAVVPKVLDFGISKVNSATARVRLTATGAMMGTPLYMSPEQARGETGVDARSDQYSFGVMLYEGATGAEPFRSSNFLALLQEILAARYRRPRELRPELPEAFERVILRAMALEPSARFGSMRELGRALLPFADAVTRERWTPEFDDAAPLSSPPPDARGDAPAFAVVDTVLSARAPRHTTLGRTGREIDVRAASRGPRAWVLGVGGAVALALCGAAYVALAHRSSGGDAAVHAAVARAPAAMPVTPIVPTQPAVPPPLVAPDAAVAQPTPLAEASAPLVAHDAHGARTHAARHARSHTADPSPAANASPASSVAPPETPTHRVGVHAVQSYE